MRLSLLVRGAWIENFGGSTAVFLRKSLLVRGAWIEKRDDGLVYNKDSVSLLVRGAWIEKQICYGHQCCSYVAPRKRGVD